MLSEDIDKWQGGGRGGTIVGIHLCSIVDCGFQEVYNQDHNRLQVSVTNVLTGSYEYSGCILVPVSGTKHVDMF